MFLWVRKVFDQRNKMCYFSIIRYLAGASMGLTGVVGNLPSNFGSGLRLGESREVASEPEAG